MARFAYLQAAEILLKHARVLSKVLPDAKNCVRGRDQPQMRFSCRTVGG